MHPTRFNNQANRHGRKRLKRLHRKAQKSLSSRWQLLPREWVDLGAALGKPGTGSSFFKDFRQAVGA